MCLTVTLLSHSPVSLMNEKLSRFPLGIKCRREVSSRMCLRSVDRQQSNILPLNYALSDSFKYGNARKASSYYYGIDALQGALW